MKSIDEYRDYVDETKAIPEKIQMASELSRAAVSAEFLTGDQNWDIYLSYVQAAINDVAKLKQAAVRALCDPLVVDINDIMRNKQVVTECQGAINAWQSIMDLPGDIIELGKTAKSITERMTAVAKDP